MISIFSLSFCGFLRLKASSHSRSFLPLFTTRQQQIGFYPRRPRPTRRPVCYSGHHYSFRDFETKAKAFEKSYLKKGKKWSQLSTLEVETLYWKATAAKPFSVEYANDMPGSARRFAVLSDIAYGGQMQICCGKGWSEGEQHLDLGFLK